jgi:hypothetical protein
MKLSVLTLLAAALVGVAAEELNFLQHQHPRAYYEDKFLTWMTEYGQNFSDAEYEQRLQNFALAEDRIAKHNAQDAAFSMAHNIYSHLTWPEFKAEKSIGRPLLSTPARPLDIKPQAQPATARRLFGGESLPKEVNWVEKGAVTDVKNQGSCGSCWSFSTTGSMEGAYYIQTGKLRSFSEQMLVDCDTYDSGCGGGLMDYSFHWIQQNGGICAEEDYPYSGSGGACQAKSCTPVRGTAVDSWVDVDQTEKALMAAVAKQPISVAIEADETSFQFYSDGVLTAGCGTNLDHGVLLVGYGTTDEGIDYWAVKNSWGPEWGSKGYIKLLRGATQQGGECGILMGASYPILAKK